jgi:hypothetical protein
MHLRVGPWMSLPFLPATCRLGNRAAAKPKGAPRMSLSCTPKHLRLSPRSGTRPVWVGVSLSRGHPKPYVLSSPSSNTTAVCPARPQGPPAEPLSDLRHHRTWPPASAMASPYPRRRPQQPPQNLPADPRHLPEVVTGDLASLSAVPRLHWWGMVGLLQRFWRRQLCRPRILHHQHWARRGCRARSPGAQTQDALRLRQGPRQTTLAASRAVQPQAERRGRGYGAAVTPLRTATPFSPSAWVSERCAGEEPLRLYFLRQQRALRRAAARHP